jgi:hypothetical protein
VKAVDTQTALSRSMCWYGLDFTGTIKSEKGINICEVLIRCHWQHRHSHTLCQFICTVFPGDIVGLIL